jgi:hypothetical protein
MYTTSIKCDVGITVSGYMWGKNELPMSTADMIEDPLGYGPGMHSMNQPWVRKVCCEGELCPAYKCATTEKHYTMKVYGGAVKQTANGFSYSALVRRVLEGKCVLPGKDDFPASCTELSASMEQEQAAQRASLGIAGTARFRLTGCTIVNRTDICTQCPAGSYSNITATGSKSCLPCMLGRYGLGGSTDIFCDGTCTLGTYELSDYGRERLVGEEDAHCGESTWVLSAILASCLVGVTLMILFLLWCLLRVTRPHEPKKIVPGQENLKGDHSHTGMLMNHM